MPVRTLVELLHIVAGLVVVRLIAVLAIWSVPNAQVSIWWVSYAVMIVVLLSGIRPLRRAWRRDRGRGATDNDVGNDI